MSLISFSTSSGYSERLGVRTCTISIEFIGRVSLEIGCHEALCGEAIIVTLGPTKVVSVVQGEDKFDTCSFWF